MVDANSGELHPLQHTLAVADASADKLVQWLLRVLNTINAVAACLAHHSNAAFDG